MPLWRKKTVINFCNHANNNNKHAYSSNWHRMLFPDNNLREIIQLNAFYLQHLINAKIYQLIFVINVLYYPRKSWLNNWLCVVCINLDRWQKKRKKENNHHRRFILSHTVEFVLLIFLDDSLYLEDFHDF